MTNNQNIRDMVSPELVDLIEASDKFKSYRETTYTTNTISDVQIKGPLGLEINPRHPLGIAIYPRA